MQLTTPDCMTYMEGMEQIDTQIMDRVLSMVEEYDYEQYTAKDVERVLAKEKITLEDYGVLLSPAALPLLFCLPESDPGHKAALPEALSAEMKRTPVCTPHRFPSGYISMLYPPWQS